MANKRAVIEQLAKNLFGGKNAYLLVMYTTLYLLPNIAFHLFFGGGRRQCILMRLTEHKPVVAMARQDLKKYCMRPHVLTLDNIGYPVL